MEFIGMIISFVVLMFIVCGVIIFFLHRSLITGTEGAVNRLNQEIAKANAKQAELNKKLKEADEELAKRQKEAQELAEKMSSEAEEKSKEEREKIVSKARSEAEEIIAKAQGSKDRLRQEIEKEMTIKTVEYSMEILNSILSEKGKGSLNSVLIDEFLENLKNTDMSKISPDINTAEVITLTALDDSVKSRVSLIIRDKLNRDVSVNATTDEGLGGGAILKFGSMALDGSLNYLIKERGISMQEKIDAQ